MSGLLAERMRLMVIPSCCADWAVPGGGSEGRKFGPLPFTMYGLPPTVERDMAGAVLRFGSSPCDLPTAGVAYRLYPLNADWALDRVEADCGGGVSLSSGEK